MLRTQVYLVLLLMAVSVWMALAVVYDQGWDKYLNSSFSREVTVLRSNTGRWMWAQCCMQLRPCLCSCV